MLNWMDKLSELSPLRMLLIAVLLAIVLAQAVAMAMLARSQVQKAELRNAGASAAVPEPGAAAQRVTTAAHETRRTLAAGDVVTR